MSDQSNSSGGKLNRRTFIGGSAALVAGGGTLAAAGASAEPNSQSGLWDYDVVVIGGGNGGAAASRDCMKNGYKTLLLEARNRLGGRTFSTKFDDTAIEMGGTWVHHTQPFVWAEIERYDLEIVETPGAVAEKMYVVMDGKRVELSLEQVMEVAMGWQAYNEASREILPRGWDLLHNREAALAADKVNAIEHLDSLELTPLQRAFNYGMIASMAHNEPEAMSYLEVMRWHVVGGGYFPTFMDSVARFKLKSGTIALVKKMIEDGGAEVRLSTPVKAIHDQGDRVIVTTARGEEISCGAIINCLPMNTIFNIDFNPPLLPEVVEAGKVGHTGAGGKIYIKVEGDIGNIASVAMGNPLDYLMTYKRTADWTLLVAFVRDTELLDLYDDEAVQEALVAHVPEAKVLSTMHYDWNSDPYSKGTYASYRPGWVDKYYDKFDQDKGRLFFASGDHGEGWRGFIDGAIGSGIRAAQRVQEKLG